MWLMWKHPWWKTCVVGAGNICHMWAAINTFPAGNYMFKVNNRDTTTMVWNMFKVNNKDTKRRHWRRFRVFIINFEHILHLCSIISIVKFEQVNAGWVVILIQMSESFRSQKHYLEKSYLAGIFVKCS